MKSITKNVIEAIATGLYLGKIPVAPGTFGTLLGLPLAWVCAHYLPPTGYMVGIVVMIAVSSISAELHERYTKLHDPGEIVIDEIVGFMITMTWLPQNWQTYALAFVFFRFFDIVKPFPIRQIDQRVKGGFGTTLDDVAAGLVANVLLQVIFSETTWLGVRLHAS